MLDIYKIVSAAACVVLLIPCTVTDIKRQRVSIPMLAAALAGSFAYALWGVLQGEETISAMFLSVMPGCFLLLIAGLAPGRIGAGDGMIFLAVGLLIGCWSAFAVMFAALVMSGVYGGVLMLMGKAGRSTTIAWMPFVLSGTLMWAGFMIWQGRFIT